MSTSGLLRDLLGNNALLVSSCTENKVLSLQSGGWSEKIVSSPRGISVSSYYITVATMDGIKLYDISSGLEHISYMPASNDTHGVKLGPQQIWAVSVVDGSVFEYNPFERKKVWTIPGFQEGNSDSACLNDFCLNGSSSFSYATGLGISDGITTWRQEAAASRGVLVDMQTNQIIFQDLLYPHTPIMNGNDLYFCNSGHGQICKYTPGAPSWSVVSTLTGFVRGMCFLNSQYLAVAVNQGRLTSVPALTVDPLAQPGIAIIDITTGEQVEFESLDVREIYDIAISPIGIQ